MKPRRASIGDLHAWMVCEQGWRGSIWAAAALSSFLLFPPPGPGYARIHTADHTPGLPIHAPSDVMRPGLTLVLPPRSKSSSPEISAEGRASSLADQTAAAKVQRITGLAGRGILLSAIGAGASPGAVQAYLRAIGARITASETDPDARFDMIVAPRFDAQGRKVGEQLLYAALHQADGGLALIEWSLDGKSQWVDATAALTGRSGFSAPVIGRQTSGYGYRRHPLLGYNRMHRGVDYGATHGAPVRAVADGVVSSAGWHGGYGQMVKLSHVGDMGSGYAHLSAITVRPGDRVRRGEVIGRVGSTGLSTGPHLHFEVYRHGMAADPAAARFASPPLLKGAEKARFRARLQRMEALAVTVDTTEPLDGYGPGGAGMLAP